MKINYEYLGTPSGMLKIFEIVFVIVAFGIYSGKPVNFADTAANTFGGGVLVACLIVTPLLLVCYLMGKTEIQETILEVALNFIFFVFLFSVSVRAFVFWRDQRQMEEDTKTQFDPNFDVNYNHLIPFGDLSSSTYNPTDNTDTSVTGYTTPTTTTTTPIPNDLSDLIPAGLTLACFTLFASVAYMVDIFFSGKNLKDAYYGN